MTADRAVRYQPRSRQRQRGFTLLEVLMSMVVLTIGLVSLMATIATAVWATQRSQADMIAKQIASEAMESIFTARDNSELTWAAIANTGAGGIFLSTPMPIYTAGTDGIIGTADDTTTGQPEVLHEPGPDGIMGTADDVSVPLTNYTRTITIGQAVEGGVPVPNLNTITITITYYTTNMYVPKTYVLVDYISPYH
jgi:prepilin-type N-terminal cleavage/methylation domain-containing protein